MDRTARAALLATIIVFGAVALLLGFLGFDAIASALVGAALGLLAGGLLVAAARRADSFDDAPTPPSPGFPGAPDREDGTPADPTDPAFRDAAGADDDVDDEAADEQ